MSVATRSDVLAHLDAQLNSLLSLRDLLAEQDDAVEAADAERVIEAVGELRVQLAGRVQLESERERLVNQWARQLGCLPDEVSASKLAELDPANGEEIRSLSRQIHTEALRVQSMHAQVQERLRSELSFVSCLVDALYPSANPGGYDPAGKVSDTPSIPSTLDVKS